MRSREYVDGPTLKWILLVLAHTPTLCMYSFVIVRDIDSVLIYIQFTDYIRFVKFAWGRGPGCPCRDFITALFWLKTGAFLGVRRERHTLYE